MEKSRIGGKKMRMYATIKFDRKIIPDHHYIVPGGYSMTANGKEYEFDFHSTTTVPVSNNSNLLQCEMRDLDLETFPEAAGFESVCNHLEKINEFFIYTGEKGDPEIKPIELQALSFWTDELGIVKAPKKLLHNCLQN